MIQQFYRDFGRHGLPAMKILVIEDELKTLNILKKGLQQAGYEVDGAADGVEGYDRIRDFEYDLVLLDLMLPKLSGWDLISLTRKFNPLVPIIALTARASVNDRVHGLKLGCDDYIVKPFSFKELLARIEAAIRRHRSSNVTELRSGDLVLDLLKKTVTRGGRAVELSTKEFLILEYLLRNEGKTVSRKMLLENVWRGSLEADTNVIEVYINFLRNKIDRDFGSPLIHTVRGVGYSLHHDGK
jgi:two-component system, OmpR family, copper resistance phosphate regulon response regulator CusR